MAFLEILNEPTPFLYKFSMQPNREKAQAQKTHNLLRQQQTNPRLHVSDALFGCVWLAPKTN